MNKSDHQMINNSTIGSNSNNNDEAFLIFFNRCRVAIVWCNKTPPFSPIVRLCSLSATLFLLLSQDKCLYEAKFDNESYVIHMKCIKLNVIDVEYCPFVKQVFLVLEEGAVEKQSILENAKHLQEHNWLPVIFDPLELSEDGVKIKRICCSSEATLFLSITGDIYALGNCGVHFSVECEQPKLLRLFKTNMQILDISAGENFFVFLARRENRKAEGPLPACHDYGELPDLLRSEQCSTDKSPTHSSTISTCNRSNEDINMESSVQNLLQQGYCLLYTQIFSMGSTNQGLLGTGDHIKRDSLYNVQKLKEVGVCSLSTGTYHTVVRTIDGRLYHWGFNNKKQLANNEKIYEISSPTELSFNASDFDAPHVDILEACCGDYRTVLLRTQGDIYEIGSERTYSQEKDFLTIQMKDISQQSYPLLLASHQLTIYNRRAFKRQYLILLHQIQNQLKQMMYFRKKFLKLNQLSEKMLKDIHEVCSHWENVLYLVITIVHTLEQFYRGDYDRTLELVAIKYYTECIQIFELYSKAYCDTYSIDGFAEAYKLLNQSYPSTTSAGEEIQDLSKMFQQPFLIFPYIIQLLERIHKQENNCREELLAWNEFSRRNRIDLELADSTREFWRLNLKYSKILHFKTNERRVVLTSTSVPIKLSQSMGLITTTFILFSDFLCQHGSHLTVMPLNAMWLKKEEIGIRVITPEKNIVLVSKNEHDIELWYDQLESTIKNVLMLSEKSKIPEIRMIDYNYASNHLTYGGVYVRGNFSNGVMHGKCRLEYPNGKMYSGDVIHGVIEGFGRMFLPKFGLYKGNFKNGKFWGRGTLIINENELYEGNFRNGRFSGHGHMRHTNYVYIGEFVDNHKSGYGVLDRTVVGEKYLGLFDDNKRVGRGICISSEGNYFEGIFANDELAGKCIAIFPNGFYYEGECFLHGPNGLGKYYMPVGDNKHNEDKIDISVDSEIRGNTLSGQLSGTWNFIRINSGSMETNCKFPKYPSSFGTHVIDNSQKWCSLFDDFENELFGDLANAANNSKPLTFALWNRVIAFINKQQEIESEKFIPRELDITNISTANATNLSHKRSVLPLQNIEIDFDKLSLNSSLLNFEKLEFSRNHSHSENTLNGLDFSSFDLFSTFSKLTHSFVDDSGCSHTYSNLMDVMENSNNTTLNSFNNSALSNCNSVDNCDSVQTEMDLIPQCGMADLNDKELAAIKVYLRDAFHYRFHPFKHLNERITNCFYRSYGCWKIKPTPLLAQQAMREWESISQRVYKFVRRLFPALPEEYSTVGESREVVSHITVLYPILLSEGIYSTMFVLYANKYSHKDEIYRQNLMQAEKLNDHDLMQYLEFDSNILSVSTTDTFSEAISLLKELKEKYTPIAMLTVIENCIEKITDAYQTISKETKTSLNADTIMPLCVILLLRAAIPHLGAELALLDDLTDCKNFQFEMNGIRGYCYTTLKASYEHIANKTLFEKK